MWVGTENGLMKIDIKNDKMESLYHDKNNKNSLTNSYITSLEHGIDDNNICVGTTYGINIVNKSIQKLINLKVYYMIIVSLFIIQNLIILDNMWISTKEEYLYIIKKKIKNMTYILLITKE